jgi:sugar O-acyltransferase (sialic acid O-acetyltransferase NeuD family)
MKTLCIYGVGGHAREVFEYAQDATLHDQSDRSVVFMADDSHWPGETVLGAPVMRRSAFRPDECEVVAALGDPASRRAMVASLPTETVFASIVHPTAVVASSVQLGPGVMIGPGAVVTAKAVIGAHVILNPQCTVAHDCVVEDFVTVAGGARLSGACRVGVGAWIGSNAAIREGLRVCATAVVGMGAMVVGNIDEPGVYAGVPARRIR